MAEICFLDHFPQRYKGCYRSKKERSTTARFLNFIIDLHIIALRKYCVKPVFLQYNDMIYIVLFYKIFIYNASNFTMPLEKKKERQREKSLRRRCLY